MQDNKPKVLFIGHYRDGNTGWANAAKEFILAMDAAGIDVVPRPVKLNNAAPNIPVRIEYLEKKSTEGCTVCIQNVLPHLMVFNSNFKNIALPFVESFNIDRTSWSSYLKQADEVWMTNTDFSFKDGYKFVPVSTDIDKFNKPLPKPEFGPDFKFYFIGSYGRRKNIGGIVRAFHTEFSYNEPVSLVLKLDKFGVDSNSLAKTVSDHCQGIRKSLKLYQNEELYKSEILITETLTEDQILGIHKECDCFINAGFGEGWSLPCFDAALAGNKIVTTKVGGPRNLPSDQVYYTEWTEDSVIGMEKDSFPEHGKGYETWTNPSISSLQIAMRDAYENRHVTVKRDMSEFSYKSVGSKIKELLCSVQ